MEIRTLARPLVFIPILILGVILLIGGIVCFYMPTIVRNGVMDELPIKDTYSFAYDIWQAPTNTRHPHDVQSITMTYYFWNVTNYDEYIKGSKPKLEQVGPYVYDEYRWKQAPGSDSTNANLYWSDDQELIHFRYHETYVYNANKTSPNLSQNDTIYTLNVPLLAILELAGSVPFINKTWLAEYLKPYHIVHELSVYQILWGYEDSLTKVVLPLAGMSPFFGLQTNDTSDYYTYETVQYSGVNHMDKYTWYKKWVGKDNLTYWGSDYCNEIRGTDASMFPPKTVQDKELLWVFIDDISRSAQLSYSETVNYKDIDLHKYYINPPELQNASLNPINAGFYSFGPSGVINLTSVQNVPVFVSKPYFLDAPDYLTNVTFLTPTPERDDIETYISIDPYTGAAFTAYKRLQMCAQVSPIDWFPESKSLPYLLHPIFWAEEGSVVSDNAVNDWKDKIGYPLKVGKIMAYIGVIFGSLLSASGIALLCYYAINHNKYVVLKSEKDALINPDQTRRV